MDFRPWRAHARILRASALLALGLTCAGLLAPPSGRAADDQRAFLRLVVNQMERGEVLVLLRGREVLVNSADLERAGVRSPGPGRRESRDGQEWVLLSSLAPGLTYRLDEAGLALALTAAPELLGTTVVDLQPGAPPTMTFRSDPAAFLNYGATTQNFETFTATVELGVSVGGGLFLTSVTRNEDGSVVRGLTSVTVDDRARLMRWVVGDGGRHRPRDRS